MSGHLLKEIWYGYKLVYVDDKFIKSFKTYLGKDAIYNIIINIFQERKYCSKVMKKHFNKEPVMNKEDTEDFDNSTKCWTCGNGCVDSDVKARDHCHNTEKYRGIEIVISILN